MTSPTANEIPPTAAEVAARFEASDPARALLAEHPTPGGFFAALREAELYADALRFAAHYLPKRQAVWWGLLCVWETLRPAPTQTLALAMQAAMNWVCDPNDENRRATQAAAKAAGLATPAGQVALAAFLSGGSLAPVDMPEVQPRPFDTAQNVASAVLLASRKAGPPKTGDLQRLFIKLAGDVAARDVTWELSEKELTLVGSAS